MPISAPILRRAAATLLAAAFAGPTLAQDTSDNWLTRLFQPPAANSVPAPAAAPAGAREWSGQSGASGHPLMTAEAIRAAAAEFGDCLAGLWPLAARRGVTRETFEGYTAGLTPDLRLMDLLDAQPEFTKSTWDYLDALVSDERIARGREILAQHAPTFAAVERTYGVDRHVIAAIWGVESKYSTMGGDRSVIRSTATLACVGRRRDFFREEFLSALEILQRGDLKPERLIGSWAGAFGPTQFMPTTFKRYAVDFDGDGRRDVVDSVPDMIASTANNLKTDGWASGEGWGYEVVLPQNFDFLLADRSRQMTLRQWQALGIARAGGQAFPRPSDRACLLVPAGAAIIDAHGRTVTPGLVNAATQLGLVEVSSATETRDSVATGGALGASFDVSYALNGNSALVALARADGLTRALSYPGASDVPPFAGLASLIRLRPGV